MREQIANGAVHIACGAIGREGIHQMSGLVHFGVLSDFAMKEIGCECNKTLGGETVTHALQLGDEAPPFLEHDHSGAGPSFRRRKVPARRIPIAFERHHVTHEADRIALRRRRRLGRGSTQRIRATRRRAPRNRPGLGHQSCRSAHRCRIARPRVPIRWHSMMRAYRCCSEG